MIILDTDHLSELQSFASDRGARLSARLEASTDSDIRIGVISYEEQVRGWMARINAEKSVARQVLWYDRLLLMLGFYEQQASSVLRFDEAAASLFEILRGRKVRIGSNDLKIAAIALSNDATLLSANLADFRQVPGLRVEDWLRP